MNHQLCPRRTLAWALLKVYGAAEATELIREQERIAFPPSFESRQYANSYFCPTIEKVDVRVKEKSCRRRGLWSPRIFIGGVVFENIRCTFVSANVAFMKGRRLPSRVSKSWANASASRNKCLSRTWLYVHVYRRNGRELGNRRCSYRTNPSAPA